MPTHIKNQAQQCFCVKIKNKKIKRMNNGASRKKIIE